MRRMTKPSEEIIDSHLHVIEGDGEFPFHPERVYDPPFAPAEALLAFHDRMGIAKAVLVQVSVYGTDNGLMLRLMENCPGRFRGVAVTEPRPSDQILGRLRDAGVLGLRLNLIHGGGPRLAEIERYAALCREAGFHLQIYIEGRFLPELAPKLGRLAIPLVFDHFGGIRPGQAASGHPVIETMVALLTDGAWVKFSAPYRISDEASGFGDVVNLGRRLLAAAPSRCLWGSDWPHVATKKNIRSEEVLDLVPKMAETAPLREALLYKNAAALYGF